jgi:hypothetical protein
MLRIVSTRFQKCQTGFKLLKNKPDGTKRSEETAGREEVSAKMLGF